MAVNRTMILPPLIALLVSCSPRYMIDHARPIRPLVLPADDAAHYTAQTEWWYYTGHCRADDGTEYGFELTFFKRLTGEDRAPACFLRVPAHWIREVGMLSHFAVTDLSRELFRAAELTNLCRRWKADPDNYHVAINGWSARSEGGSHLLRASMRGYAVDLKLTPVKPAALNGPNGILDKGMNANYYYSYTNMNVGGTITAGGAIKNVKGKAWMDHEFGPMALMNTHIGWDWFSVQLDDETELMLYFIREGERVVSQSGGTFVDRDGRTRWLKIGEMEVKATGTWTSPKTGAVYPSGWEIAVRPLDIKLIATPMMAGQELALQPVTYWEGAVAVRGTVKGRASSGKGYVELVGYDKKSSFGTKK
jgi:predicted secreted hydrolase